MGIVYGHSTVYLCCVQKLNMKTAAIVTAAPLSLGVAHSPTIPTSLAALASIALLHSTELKESMKSIYTLMAV